MTRFKPSSRSERRAADHPKLVAQYLKAGFSKDQAELLVNKILDRRQPWRPDIVLACGLTLMISTGIGLLTSASIGDIQASRIEACEDTNQRNQTTVAALNSLTDQAILDHPEREAQLNQSRDSSILLINALVPVRDCEDVVG